MVGRRRPRRPARGSGERDVWPLGKSATCRSECRLELWGCAGASRRRIRRADQIRRSLGAWPVCVLCVHPGALHHPGERRRRYAQRANELRVRPSRCPRTALSADKAFAGQPDKIRSRTALSADRTFAGQGVKKRGEPSAPSPAQAAEIDKMRRKIGAREIHNWRRARARAPHPVSQSVSQF